MAPPPPRKTVTRTCWVDGCPQYGIPTPEALGYQAGSHYDRNHADVPHEALTPPSELAARRGRSARRAS